MKALPEICRYGLKAPPGSIKFVRGRLVLQSQQEVLHDLLETVRKRLTTGNRVEGRVLAHLLEQLGNDLETETRSLIETLVTCLGDPQIPLVPSKYAKWAQANVEHLSALLKKVESLLLAQDNPSQRVPLKRRLSKRPVAQS